jgi:hypothetical protein
MFDPVGTLAARIGAVAVPEFVMPVLAVRDTTPMLVIVTAPTPDEGVTLIPAPATICVTPELADTPRPEARGK